MFREYFISMLYVIQQKYLEFLSLAHTFLRSLSNDKCVCASPRLIYDSSLSLDCESITYAETSSYIMQRLTFLWTVTIFFFFANQEKKTRAENARRRLLAFIRIEGYLTLKLFAWRQIRTYIHKKKSQGFLLQFQQKSINGIRRGCVEKKKILTSRVTYTQTASNFHFGLFPRRPPHVRATCYTASYICMYIYI